METQITANETVATVYPERIHHIVIGGKRYFREFIMGVKPYRTGTLLMVRQNPSTIRVSMSITHPTDHFCKKDGVRRARELMAQGTFIDLNIPDSVPIYEVNDLVMTKLYQEFNENLENWPFSKTILNRRTLDSRNYYLESF